MDWDAKWTWENLVLFNLKTVEKPKNQTKSWQIEDEIMGKGHFRYFESKGSSCRSELAPGSSTKSSVSVLTDSSFKDVMENTQVAVGNVNAFSESFCGKEELDMSSVRSGESTIWLKLGKKMYLENNSSVSNAKTVSLDGVSRSSVLKKIKLSNVNGISCCQVEGCNVDLSSAREYHRKQKVCAIHSKCPKVVIKGLERRFCQQCSRFHGLSEFDKNKRSCRKRLSEHNTRRRKPQFSTMRLPSPFSAYVSTEGTRQISFTPNNIPHIYRSDSTCQNALSSKFTDERGVMLKFGKTEGIDEHLLIAGTGLPLALNFPGHSSNRLVPSKGNESQTLPLGFEKPVLPTNSDSGRDFHGALSLLSNNSWGYPHLSNNSLDRTDNINHICHQPLMLDFPHIFPRNSSEFSQIDHHSTDNLHNHHSQLFKEPCEDVFHSNLFN